MFMTYILHLASRFKNECGPVCIHGMNRNKITFIAYIFLLVKITLYLRVTRLLHCER